MGTPESGWSYVNIYIPEGRVEEDGNGGYLHHPATQLAPVGSDLVQHWLVLVLIFSVAVTLTQSNKQTNKQTNK